MENHWWSQPLHHISIKQLYFPWNFSAIVFFVFFSVSEISVQLQKKQKIKKKLIKFSILNWCLIVNPIFNSLLNILKSGWMNWNNNDYVKQKSFSSDLQVPPTNSLYSLQFLLKELNQVITLFYSKFLIPIL